MKWLIGYAAAGTVFVVLDALWLMFMGPAVYRPAHADLLADRINIWAAILFYAVFIAGILFLAVQPGLKANSLAVACMSGAALGFIAYATYDLTNLATLKGWSATVAAIDMAWGTVLTAVAAGAGYWAMRA